MQVLCGQSACGSAPRRRGKRLAQPAAPQSSDPIAARPGIQLATLPSSPRSSPSFVHAVNPPVRSSGVQKNNRPVNSRSTISVNRSVPIPQRVAFDLAGTERDSNSPSSLESVTYDISKTENGYEEGCPRRASLFSAEITAKPVNARHRKSAAGRFAFLFYIARFCCDLPVAEKISVSRDIN
jgi:hypothetical protein